MLRAKVCHRCRHDERVGPLHLFQHCIFHLLRSEDTQEARAGGRGKRSGRADQAYLRARVEEAAATLGADGGVVAVSCPFCLTMLKDGIAETGREERLQVLDVAEIVASALPAEEDDGAARIPRLRAV